MDWYIKNIILICPPLKDSSTILEEVDVLMQMLSEYPIEMGKVIGCLEENSLNC